MPPPTWSSIVAALKSSLVNLTQLAEMIEARYLQPSDESKKPPTWYRHISEVEQLDSRQKALLNERLRMESEDIQLKFNLLCSKFFISLASQQVPVQTLTDYLKDLEPLKRVRKASKSYERSLKKLKDLKDVKKFVKEQCTFFDWRPLEHLIELAGAVRDRQELHTYQEHFDQYARCRIYECSSEVGPGAMPGHTPLCVKVETDYDKLVEIKQFQCRLCLLLQISFLRLSSIEEGCLQLTFLIPQFVQDAIFPLSTKQELSLKELGVFKLTCGDYHYPRSSSKVRLF